LFLRDAARQDEAARGTRRRKGAVADAHLLRPFEYVIVLIITALIAIMIASATWHLAWNIAVLLGSSSS
jgi:hypothetical protein